MITFLKLGQYGDIGNQLFQYATLISLGKDLGYEIKIPKCFNYYSEAHKKTVNYFTEGFKITTQFLEDNDIQCIKNYYDEPVFNFTPINNIIDNTSIAGYFQSEKYFLHNKQFILQNLEFKEEIIEEAKQNYDINFIEKSCFLHVRRGDYIHQSAYYHNLDINYYKKSLDIINPEYISIFSDDIKWCHENFNFLDQNKLEYISSSNPFLDLYLMTQTQNCVIANSSFSWWGAWLNQNQNKTIIAPKNWFAPSYLNSQDIYYKDCVIL
jgi:hypothetical protein